MIHHLGSWVSALADGQLGPAETERALAHVAACPSCADELVAARQARRALSVVADAEPAPDLTARLLALAAEPLRPVSQAGAFATGAGLRAPVLPLGSSAYSAPARALTGDLTARRRPGRRFAAATVASLGMVAASLFVLGAARPVVVPSGHPADALSMLGSAGGSAASSRSTWAPGLATQIAASTASAGSSATTSDAAVLAWMREAGWTCPRDLPAGYEVTAARLTGTDGALLELDLDGPAGPIVLTEERGELDVAALAGARELSVGDLTVHVLTREPWHAVWQSGGTVVSIVADGPTDAAVELMAGFPTAGYDDGLPARITRGWDTVTGALARP